MKERLIPYGPTMVRAKRAGLKTMTRRVVKGTALEWLASGFTPEYVAAPENHLCPYGVPGDILVTREAWRTLAIYDRKPPRDLIESTPIWYEADGPAPDWYNGRYRHARFMCRWMARDRDEITAVRIERLQDISEEDARAEGAAFRRVGTGDVRTGMRDCWTFEGIEGLSARDAYRDLWEKLNGPGSWDLNPYVWVLTFRRLTP